MVFREGVLLKCAKSEICRSILLQKKRTATVKNCFIQNHFNPKAQLIFTWTGNQCYQKYFVVVSQTGIRWFAWKKNWPFLANLSEVIFIDEQCWHLEQTTLSGFKTLFIKKGSLSHKLLAILWNWKKSSKS